MVFIFFLLIVVLLKLNIILKRSYPSTPDKVNEDSIGSTNKALWVIDGATNVFQGQKITKYDVAWYSNRLTELLLKYIDDSSCSIEEILKRIIKQIREEVKNEIGEKFSIFEIQVTASILICRYIQDKLEVFSLGDCIAYFQIQEQELFLQNYHMMQIESNMIKKSFSERGKLEYNKFLKSAAFPKIQRLITKNTNIRNLARCVHPYEHIELGMSITTDSDNWKETEYWEKGLPSIPRRLDALEHLKHHLSINAKLKLSDRASYRHPILPEFTHCPDQAFVFEWTRTHGLFISKVSEKNFKRGSGEAYTLVSFLEYISQFLTSFEERRKK